jgi:hypothetical protein
MAPFLTSAELATRWRRKRQTLANWRHTGQGPPFIRLQGKVLYPIEGIEACERLASDWTNPDNIQSQQQS